MDLTKTPKRWTIAIVLGLLVTTMFLWTVYRDPAPDPNRVYRVIFNQNPPYYHQHLGEKPQGVMIDLFEAAAARGGIRLEWKLWQDAPEDLFRANQADLLLLAVSSPERAKEFYLTEPWLRIEGVLVWLKQPGQEGLPNLTGKRIGVPGYRLYENMARKNFAHASIVRRASRKQLVEMLCTADIDAAIIDARSVTMVLLDRPTVCNGLALAMDDVEEVENSLVIMANRDSRQAADTLREGISSLSADGTMRKLYQKWGVGFLPEVHTMDAIQKEKRRTNLLRYLLAGSAVLFLAVAILAVKLRHALFAADRASQAKSNFLATMSHETRTPLNGIIGLAEALREDSSQEEHRQMATSIAECGRSLVSLVNDVLDHSKLEAGLFELNLVPFSIRDTIRPIEASLGRVARQKSISFDCRIDSAVPEWVLGDPQRLTQVLFNLVGNAIKFTEAGHVRLDIDATADAIRFAVADTGIGMSEAEQAQLFQAFWQANQSSTRKFGGTGLGLSISRRLIEKMGSSIEVESRQGAGSTFSFRLALPVAAAPTPVSTPTPATPATTPLKVLLADDNQINQRVIERLLLKLGHTVHLAGDGRQAVEQFEANPFDLVLLDCHMPVEDGFSAARRIRQLELQRQLPHVPILAVTALAFAEDRQRCFDAGMDGHIPKPVSLASLLEAIRKWAPPPATSCSPSPTPESPGVAQTLPPESSR